MKTREYYLEDEHPEVILIANDYVFIDFLIRFLKDHNQENAHSPGFNLLLRHIKAAALKQTCDYCLEGKDKSKVSIIDIYNTNKDKRIKVVEAEED